MKPPLITIVFLLLANQLNAQDHLYYLCRNEISWDTTKSRLLSANGADYFPEDKSLVIIPNLPNKSQVTMVYEKGRIKAMRSFKVIKSPLPTIGIFSNGYNITNQDTLSHLYGNITILAIRDPGFATDYNTDCRYRVSNFTLELLRNGELINDTLRKPNDVLQITVMEVERLNFRGQIEKIPIHKVLRKRLT